ncbi:MAG: porin [Paracoccaceae bacterium]
MKKVLFAATALVAVGSMAAAEVRLSGYGRFGLDYNSGHSNTAAGVTAGGLAGVSKTTITSRLRLQFDMSAETDGGVGFGARYRAQSESRDNSPGAATFNGGRFFVTYEGFSLYVGNMIGAFDNIPGTYLETRTAGTGVDGAGFVSHVGNVNSEYFNWDSYSSGGAGRNGMDILYSGGGFTGHLSYSQSNVYGVAAANGGPTPALTAGETRLERIGYMGAYTFGDWTIAVGGQQSTALWEDKIAVSIAGDLGQWGVRLAYGDNDGIQKWGLYGNVDIGAASNIVLWVTSEDAVSATDVAAGRGDNRDSVAGSNQQEGESYGIHYSYDLGGGVSFETGYRRQSNDNDTFQAGVYFSF